MKTISQDSDKGFTLIEVILVLLAFSFFTTVGFRMFQPSEINIENTIITSQIKAMALRSSIMLDVQICPAADCWFNAKGNINKARSLIIKLGEKNVELVIWLGFGRFKIK